MYRYVEQHKHGGRFHYELYCIPGVYVYEIVFMYNSTPKYRIREGRACDCFCVVYLDVSYKIRKQGCCAVFGGN